MSVLPPQDVAGMPALIRDGGPQARAMYAAGLAFEQQLIGQLTQSLDLTGTNADDSGDDSIVTSMLPQALAQSLTEAGGLGLAAQLAAPFVDHSSTDD